MKRSTLALVAGFAALLASPADALEANVNYALKCLGCHTADGVSPEHGRIPPLLDVVGYFTITPEARRYMANVPGIVNSGLDEAETAALLNWVVKTYGRASYPENFKPFDGAEVAALREKRVDDPMRLREEVRQLLGKLGISLAAYP